MAYLRKVMKLVSDKNRLSINFRTDFPCDLIFFFGDPCKDLNKSKVSWIYVLLLEVDEDSLDVPETKHQCEVTM